jgi:hypothetical protein
MTLGYELGSLAGQCKHAPETVDLDDVRQALRRAEEAVNMLCEVRMVTEWLAYTTSQGGRLRMTIDTDDPVGWMARLEQVLE